MNDGWGMYSDCPYSVNFVIKICLFVWLLACIAGGLRGCEGEKGTTGNSGQQSYLLTYSDQQMTLKKTIFVFINFIDTFVLFGLFVVVVVVAVAVN